VLPPSSRTAHQRLPIKVIAASTNEPGVNICAALVQISYPAVKSELGAVTEKQQIAQRRDAGVSIRHAVLDGNEAADASLIEWALASVVDELPLPALLEVHGVLSERRRGGALFPPVSHWHADTLSAARGCHRVRVAMVTFG
jgi:hypothetical protein